MNVELEQLLQFIVLLSTVLTMFYKLISTINRQSLKIDELYNAMKKFEEYEKELANTKHEISELKHEIKAIKYYMTTIESTIKELKQEKALLLEILKNTLKQPHD